MRKRRVAACLALCCATIVFTPLLVCVPNAMAADPHVDSMSPTTVTNGTTVTISGNGFGSTQGLNDGVVVGGDECTNYTTWTDSKIVCKVGDRVADNWIYVYTSHGQSNGLQVVHYTSSITSVSPTTAHVGDTVAIKGGCLLYPGVLGTVYLHGQQIPDAYITTKTQAEIKFTVSGSMTSGSLYCSNDLGNTNSKTLTVDKGDQPTGKNIFFAEGCSNYGFDTWYEALLKTTYGVPVETTYMTPERPVARDPIEASQTKKVVIHANAELPNKDFSFQFHSDDPSGNYSMTAHRIMYWGNAAEGHMSVGFPSPATTWYLAEGCTDYGFETWLLLQNPSNSNAVANITYMTPQGPVASPQKTIPANSRVTVNVNGELPNKECSIKVEADKPIMAERAMYWGNRRGGTCSGGTTTPSQDYFLAEGTTAYGFDEWILVQNPNNEQITVDVAYMTYSGAVGRPQIVMAPNSRQTIHANTDIPGQDISVQLHGSKSIVAERAMYWNNGSGKAGHDSIGTSAANPFWAFGAGHAEAPYETYVLIQNPNNRTIQVKANYYDENGQTGQFAVNVPALSRYTINPANTVPGKSIAITVGAYELLTASQKREITAGRRIKQTPVAITAEEAIYWNNKTGGVSALGEPK